MPLLPPMPPSLLPHSQHPGQLATPAPSLSLLDPITSGPTRWESTPSGRAGPAAAAVPVSDRQSPPAGPTFSGLQGKALGNTPATARSPLSRTREGGGATHVGAQSSHEVHCFLLGVSMSLF